jgi:pimeloyl-ACP methyl ester carboxylesterase
MDNSRGNGMPPGSEVSYTIRGQEICGYEVGSGETTAILLHGWSSSRFAVSPLFPILSQYYRCLAVDLPGYGDSAPLPERVSIPAYAELIARLARKVSDRPVVMVGHSMGGMISLVLAMRYPELVDRLILLCPTISGRLSQRINLTLAPFVILEHFPVTHALVSVLEPIVPLTDRLLRPSMFADRTRISEADYQRIKADTRRRDQAVVRAESFWAMRDCDLRGKLAQINIPSLVIWGMEDSIIPLSDAYALSAEWPEANFYIIPQAGHWPHFEMPEITEWCILRFHGEHAKKPYFATTAPVLDTL